MPDSGDRCIAALERLVGVLEAPPEPWTSGLGLLLRSFLFGHNQVSLRQALASLPPSVRTDLCTFFAEYRWDWPDDIIDPEYFHALID